MAWSPGQSGNPAGTPRAKPFLDALNRAIAQDDGKRLRGAAERLLTLADAGESWAVQMIADRLDGKAAQAVELSGELGIRKAVDLSDDQLAEIAHAGRPKSPA